MGLAYPIDNALFQWEDGWRVLQGLGGDRLAQRRAERVVEAVRDELRLRIGATFTLADLADLYGQDTDWCLAIVCEVDPGAEGRSLVDAAFWLHRRGASDFAGGRTADAAPGRP